MKYVFVWEIYVNMREASVLLLNGFRILTNHVNIFYSILPNSLVFFCSNILLQFFEIIGIIVSRKE